MPVLNDLALAVEEREPGQFFWTLLEAHHGGDASETLDYRVYRTAPKPQATYSNALALGAQPAKPTEPTAAQRPPCSVQAFNFFKFRGRSGPLSV
eukprot:gene40107-54224_t